MTMENYINHLYYPILKKMILKKCKYCNKEIEGYNSSHTDYMMNQHLIGIHSELVEIIKIKKHGGKENEKI